MPRTLKIAAILYCILLVAVLLSLRDSAVTGYEISIYANTPLLAWVFITGSIIGGVAILAWQAFRSGNGHGSVWFLGFLLIIIGNFLVCYLSALRGYFLYNPIDPSAHIGMSLDIVTTGHIGANNIYPITHILMAQISQVTGLASVEIARLLPALLSTLYVAVVFLLANVIFRDKRQVWLTVAFGAPLLFSFFQTAIYPQALAFFTLPIIYYVYFRGRFVRTPQERATIVPYRLLLALLIISIPLAHPHSAIVAILFLIITEITLAIYNKVVKTREEPGAMLPATPGFSLNNTVIGFTILFLWLAPLDLFRNTVLRMISMVAGGGQISPPQLSFAVDKIQLIAGADFILYGLKSYGHILLYAVIVMVALLIIFVKVFRGDRSLMNHAILGVWLIAGELFALLFFFVVWVQVPSRVIAADNAMLLAPVFVAFVFYLVLAGRRFHTFIKVAVVVIVVGMASIIGIFSLYRSPLVYQANWQAMHSDIAGTRWLFFHRETGLYWNGLSVFHTDLEHIFGHSAYGTITDISMEEQGARIGYYGWFDVPTHFGYYGFWADRKFNTIGEMYADKGEEVIGKGDQYHPRHYVGYWVITQRAKTVAFDPGLRERRISSHSEIGRWDFNPEDFERLANDPTIDRVYQNGEYEVWYIPASYAD